MKEKVATPTYPVLLQEIQRFLPHRPPFLLIDRVDHVEPKGDLTNPFPSADKIGTRVVATKAVTFVEPHFQGHFPGNPVMPGVLIIEAMAQASAFVFYPFVHHNLGVFAQDTQIALCGVDTARFRRPVIPGDQIQFHIELTRLRGLIAFFDAEARVDGQKVADAQFFAMYSSKALNLRKQGEKV